ncbi:hypothetical protein Tco_0044458 [Tanacetum coccineum]
MWHPEMSMWSHQSDRRFKNVVLNYGCIDFGGDDTIWKVVNEGDAKGIGKRASKSRELELAAAAGDVTLEYCQIIVAIGGGQFRKAFIISLSSTTSGETPGVEELDSLGNNGLFDEFTNFDLLLDDS